ncbi:MAG TPA: hypothetical protein PK175_00015 [Syntrophales bacterium]|nr:hypothetical protein [Syntrophales bacterium]HON22347.1 hypothetical protein [Syntrophales bacterium]HOU76579.1 hypothetical protein [Syntrophales bacterium]HPC31336.1 hypothetical protein [Syntrophales bacterium]HQG33242.1 hypothetical protein [Syntrophales bacterium]
MTILFICTANIVRSFLAERILKGMLLKADRRDVVVCSAGLIDMHGAPGDPTAAKILAEHNFDGRNHVSKPYQEDDLLQADMIVVMENSQREQLLRTHPQHEGKVRLLKTFSRDYDGINGDIKDPYRLSPYHYRLCFAEIYTAIVGLLKCI